MDVNQTDTPTSTASAEQLEPSSAGGAVVSLGAVDADQLIELARAVAAHPATAAPLRALIVPLVQLVAQLQAEARRAPCECWEAIESEGGTI